MADRNQQQTSNARPGQAGDLYRQTETTPDELDNETDVERVEVLASGAEDTDDVDEDGLGEKLSALAASTEEEVDALRVNLTQDDYPPSTRDSSGRVVDDTAQERLARFTEADPMQGDIGVVSVEPGRDDTSRILRRHHPNTTIANQWTRPSWSGRWMRARLAKTTRRKRFENYRLVFRFRPDLQASAQARRPCGSGIRPRARTARAR